MLSPRTQSSLCLRLRIGVHTRSLCGTGSAQILSSHRGPVPLSTQQPRTYNGNDVRQHVSLRHLVQTSLQMEGSAALARLPG